MVDAGMSLPGCAAPQLAAEICFPADCAFPAAPLAFVCLPGGSINRRYFDLGGDAQPSFSFARQMAQHGMITIAIDHIGVGESTRPADGFLLTPNVIVAANAQVTSRLVQQLKSGTLASDLPALPGLRTVGVGHSMGGMLTVMQQALDPAHIALVLLGFSNNGLMKYLPEPAHALIGAPEQIPDRIAEIARQIYPSAYPELTPSPEGSAMFYGSRADRDGVEALKAARDVLLVMPGTQSMIPGSIAPHLQTIDVPVFLGLGDQDIAGPTHAIPAIFPRSNDVSLLVLPETGHCQFIFASRTALFRRIADWSAMIRDDRQ
jgi:pimeloyl-ACP methyl ester carboxylesterase